MKDLQWFSVDDESINWNDFFSNTLKQLGQSFVVLKSKERFALAAYDKAFDLSALASDVELLGILPAADIGSFGDSSFQEDYATKANYMAGAMANGIASVELVVAMAKAGFLGSFGSGGLPLAQVEKAIIAIKEQLTGQPFAVNFLSNPYSPDYENNLVDLYLQHAVKIIEASAFIEPSAALVLYRARGLSRSADGQIVIAHKIIAKISRQEVATKFLMPAADKLLEQLVAEEKISTEQAALAKEVPLADDITVEADSGGHTDNRPLVSLLPSILVLRERICREQGYANRVRIGAAGGISTPQSIFSVFAMGADYVVTGSINQACIEAGTSAETKELLVNAKMADVAMAPSADMFEMGVQVQVLKNGTRFPLVSKKLYELYKSYDSLAALPETERKKLEATAFKKSVDDVWQETRAFFQERDPSLLAKAEQDPKKIMALVFRWYLGKSSMWAITGDAGQMINAQIWCGQAMGAFNDWAKGGPLEQAQNRKAGAIGLVLMQGCALLSRCFALQSLGLNIASRLALTPAILEDIK